MALATQTDVEQRLQIDFTNPTEPVVVSLIAAAQGHIEREVGRPVEADDYTETFDGPYGPYLWLTKVPVNTITSVTSDGTVLTVIDDFFFVAQTGKVGRVKNGYYRFWDSLKPQSVVVVYNGGFTTVPLDLRDLCANVVARAFQAGAVYAALPASAGSISSISLDGSDSVEYSDGVAGGLATTGERPVQLTPEEVAICRSYRLRRFGFA